LTSPAIGEVRLTVRLTGADALANQPLMNDSSQDVWFYTQGGEKGGPVDFPTLQRSAREGKLHPRLDLIWAQGMDRWQPAGEIQGLFDFQPAVLAPVATRAAGAAPERRTTVVPRAKTAVDPYGSAEEEYAYGRTGSKVVMPGARRRSYLFFLVVFPMLWFAVVRVASSILGERVGQETFVLIASGLLVLPGLVGLVFCFMRLVNLGMSGWWFLGILVPFLNLWVGYRCFACPAGFAIHKKMDGVGNFLAILYWLLMAVGLVAIGGMAAVIFGHMGPPELREQIVETIKEGINMSAEP
jgi:uncharacterized membrane protein YhaH (DUF805 family)